MGWRDHIIPNPEPNSAGPSWRDHIVPDDPDLEQVDSLSLLRSMLEGHTGGVSEPVISALKAGAQVPMSQNLATMDDPESYEGFSERYAKDVTARKALKEKNPYLHMGAEFTGAAIPGPLNIPSKILKGAQAVGALAKGTAAAKQSPKIAKAVVPVLESAGTGAAMTGVRHGAQKPTGFLEDSNTVDDLKNSALVSAAIPPAGLALKGIGKAIKTGAKMTGTLLGPSVKSIDARLKGKAKDVAADYPELADQMGEDLKQIKNQIAHYDAEAYKTLTQQPAISRFKLIDFIKKKIDENKIAGRTIGPVDKKINSFLAELNNDIRELPRTVSQIQVKGLIKKLDDNIDWDAKSIEKLNQVLKGIRDSFDTALKKKNQAYELAMVPVARRMDTLHKMKTKFNFENKPGQGLVPTDTTATKIQGSTQANRRVTRDLLENVNSYVGNNYNELAKEFEMAKNFQIQSPKLSSRKVNAFAGIGAGIGTGIAGPVGGLLGLGIGAATGGTMDAYGGKALGLLIDNYLKAMNYTGKVTPELRKSLATAFRAQLAKEAGNRDGKTKARLKALEE